MTPDQTAFANVFEFFVWAWFMGWFTSICFHVIIISAGAWLMKKWFTDFL